MTGLYPDSQAAQAILGSDLPPNKGLQLPTAGWASLNWVALWRRASVA